MFRVQFSFRNYQSNFGSDVITIIIPIPLVKAQVEGLIDFQPFLPGNLLFGSVKLKLDKENPIKQDPESDDPSNKF